MARINEKLGVPKGIEKQAKKLFNEVMYSLFNMNNDLRFNSRTDGEPKVIEIGKFDININDLTLSEVRFYLHLINYDVDKPIVSRLGCSSEPEFLIDDGLVKVKTVENSFLIEVVGNNKFTKDEILKVINEVKVSAVAHELKHLYDNCKTQISNLSKFAEYSSYQIGKFPKIISKFLHLLYYTTTTENLVRPTEMYQELLDNNVTKENFLEFMKSSQMIKKLEEAENFSIDEFKKELNKSDDVKKTIDELPNDFKKSGNYADDMLNLLFINISNNALGSTQHILQGFINQNSGGIFDEILSYFGENSKNKEVASKTFNKIVRKYKKYHKNPQKYFDYIEKKINFTGKNLKRKLYKLYDMIPETTNTNSVLNWDLHTKINSKNEKLVYTLNFDDFKSKK